MTTLTERASSVLLAKPILLTKNNAKKKKLKNFNIQLDEVGVKKVEKLKDRISPSTKSEVFRSSLQLLDAIVDEVDAGTVFYMKKKGSSKTVRVEFVE